MLFTRDFPDILPYIAQVASSLSHEEFLHARTILQHWSKYA